MSRVKRFFVSHRVCFGLFVFVMAYQILVGNNLSPWRLNEHFITFYTVDYGLGFCSRFLPGAVYRLFFDQVDVQVIQFKVSNIVLTEDRQLRVGSDQTAAEDDQRRRQKG